MAIKPNLKESLDLDQTELIACKSGKTISFPNK